MYNSKCESFTSVVQAPIAVRMAKEAMNRGVEVLCDLLIFFLIYMYMYLLHQ